MFCSHAHEDHVGGLAAALAYFPADHVYSPVTEASTKCFKDFVKYTQQQGLQVEVPSVGTVWALGSATVTMLGPVAQYSETNNTSLVLRIDYGSTSFLLTGDMETDRRDRPCEQRCQPEGRCFTGRAPRLQHQHRIRLSERCSAGNGRHLLRGQQQVRPPPRGDPEHPAGCRGGRLPHRPARDHHHRQRRPELHRGHREHFVPTAS